MYFIHTMLYNILKREFNFCCLCLETVDEKKIHVQDEILLNMGDSENSVKISDILAHILSTEICNTISCFETICKQCVKDAVNSYKFITRITKNSEILNKSFSNLTSCLENTEYMMDINTLFVTMNKDDFTCHKYLDSKQPISSKSLALKRLKSLFNKYESNLEIKIEEDHDIKMENEVVKYIVPKRKRKTYAYSVPLKTSEMLLNKDDRSTFQCKACFKIYPSLSNLRNHFIRVHSPKIHKCSICQRKFGSQALLESHQNDCHSTFVCKECGRVFNNRHTLKMHEINHNLKLVCQDCGRIYKSQYTFKKHIDSNICGQKTRASPADAKFTCDYCNKKYTQKVTLRVHIQYEHGNYKSHECKWCKKKFWAPSRLQAHILKHTQEKKFTCNTCGGKFVTKESLLYHTRTHTGEKPYKCEFCDTRFLSASRRADHTKRHHTNAIFVCKICKVECTTQVSLKNHMKTHEILQNNDIYSLDSKKQICMNIPGDPYLDVSDEDII